MLYSAIFNQVDTLWGVEEKVKLRRDGRQSLHTHCARRAHLHRRARVDVGFTAPLVFF